MKVLAILVVLACTALYVQAQNVICGTGTTSKTVTLEDGDSYNFKTQRGKKYKGNTKCTVDYKMGNNCAKMSFRCTRFNTNNKDKRRCTKGDKVKVTTNGKSKVYCKKKKPKVTSTGDMKVVFTSDARKHSSGAACKVKCTEAAPEYTTSGGSTGDTCTCGQRFQTSKIVGGQETEVNEYPWQVGLVNAGWGTSVWCGATLISDQWIMTAAHCTDGASAEDIEVLVGEHNYYTDTETTALRLAISEIRQHEDYDSSTVDVDFSLLKLETPIDFTAYPYIRPACLPENDDNDYAGYSAIVSGWGTTSSGGYVTSYLQDVEVNVLSNSDCSNSYGASITEQMLCANVEGGGKDACQGDSGGPLVSRNPDLFELIGVVSWGYGCAEADYPGVYARMSKQLAWVTDQTAGSWNTCGRCPDGEECGGPTVAPAPVPTPAPSYTCTCGQRYVDTKIVGGQETEVNEYPWQVGLVSAGWAAYVWCGATLISDQWIMTAAHCTDGSSAEDIEVLVGEHNYDTDTETTALRLAISEIVQHEDYDSSTTDVDFSLLKLETPIDFTAYPYIRPACLPDNDDNDYAGYSAIVSGWGTTSSGGVVSSYLQDVEVNVLSNSDCSNSYGSSITEQMLCANVEGGGKDACQGDSGGPLVSRNPDLFELIGVVSWGAGCALADYPGVYARMSKQLAWVAEKTAGSWNTCGRVQL